MGKNSLDWKQHDDELISWWCIQIQSDGSPWCWESISKTAFIHDENSKSEKPSAWWTLDFQLFFWLDFCFGAKRIQIRSLLEIPSWKVKVSCENLWMSRNHHVAQSVKRMRRINPFQPRSSSHDIIQKNDHTCQLLDLSNWHWCRLPLDSIHTESIKSIPTPSNNMPIHSSPSSHGIHFIITISHQFSHNFNIHFIINNTVG